MNRLWALGVLVFGACAEPSISIDDFCREVAQAACEAGKKHCDYSESIDCTKVEPRVDCLMQYREEFRSGDRNFDAITAKQCVDDIREGTRVCSSRFLLSYDSCRNVAPGNSNEGEPCGACDANLECNPTGDGGCGICVARPKPVQKQLGERCFEGLGTSECPAGSWCRADGSHEGVCAPLPVLGEHCEVVCAAGLICHDAVCERVPELGEACDWVCAEGAACGDGMCVPVQPVGSACKTNICERGLVCAAGTCAQPRNIGDRCDDSSQCEFATCYDGKCGFGGAAGTVCGTEGKWCAPDLSCTDGQCTEPPNWGEPCADNKRCASGFICTAGICSVKTRSECR